MTAFEITLMDSPREECYVSFEESIMSAQPQRITSGSTEAYIRELASRHHIVFVPTALDAFAQDVTRLAADHVRLDEVECLLIGLQRAGHLSRPELVHLQARYLREAKP
jgi:hypothetical protein